MNLYLEGLLVFIVMFIDDILWAKYIERVQAGNKNIAGIYSAFIYILSASAFAAFVHDYVMIVPGALGCYFGTYYGMKDEV